MTGFNQTFRDIASGSFFDDDDHIDTLHIVKKMPQGRRYKTTGELDLEKAKEIDNEIEKVERRYTKPAEDIENFEISDVVVLQRATNWKLDVMKRKARRIYEKATSDVMKAKARVELMNISRILKSREKYEKVRGGM